VGDDHPGKKEKRKLMIIQKKDLAKFGYILDMKKIKKNKNPSLFLAIPR